MRCLVAEDDATNRALLKSFLARYGSCQIASDGKEAVLAVEEACKSRQYFDLICMDLQMPEMVGHEAIRAIRKLENLAGVSKPAIIIVTTSHTDPESISQALLSRCDGYLAKPIHTANLVAELKRHGLVA